LCAFLVAETAAFCGSKLSAATGGPHQTSFVMPIAQHIQRLFLAVLVGWAK
jgi:hypothetical protein